MRCTLAALHRPRVAVHVASSMQKSNQGTGVAPVKARTLTCRRCKQQFFRQGNHPQACRYHTAIYTGGEIGKAIGFCRASSAPEDQLVSVVGRTGIIRFWDCCGAEDPDAPGCCTGWHRGYDDPEDD